MGYFSREIAKVSSEILEKSGEYMINYVCRGKDVLIIDYIKGNIHS